MIGVKLMHVFGKALAKHEFGVIMSPLLSAHSQMGISLAFHIVFAVIGVSLPLMEMRP
jgi:hypothetical protein